jgi:hypothetical protein
MSCDHLLKELRLLESNPLFDIYLDLFLLCLLGLGYPDLKDTIFHGAFYLIGLNLRWQGGQAMPQFEWPDSTSY